MRKVHAYTGDTSFLCGFMGERALNTVFGMLFGTLTVAYMKGAEDPSFAPLLLWGVSQIMLVVLALIVNFPQRLASGLFGQVTLRGGRPARGLDDPL